jgi:hypothetical protein
MKQITLRNIPDRVGQVARREARKRGISLNKAFIGLLEKAVGIGEAGGRERKVAHDLDGFCGVWTKGEGEEFDRRLADQRTVDGELWKVAE